MNGCPFRDGRWQTGLLRHSGVVFLVANIIKTADLDHQSYPPIRLDKGFRMRQNHGPYLLLRHRLLIPTLIKTSLVDFTSYPVSLHTMAGAGEEEYYGFFKFHIAWECPCTRFDRHWEISARISLLTGLAFFERLSGGLRATKPRPRARPHLLIPLPVWLLHKDYTHVHFQATPGRSSLP